MNCCQIENGTSVLVRNAPVEFHGSRLSERQSRIQHRRSTRYTAGVSGVDDSGAYKQKQQQQHGRQTGSPYRQFLQLQPYLDSERRARGAVRRAHRVLEQVSVGTSSVASRHWHGQSHSSLDEPSMKWNPYPSTHTTLRRTMVDGAREYRGAMFYICKQQHVAPLHCPLPAQQKKQFKTAAYVGSNTLGTLSDACIGRRHFRRHSR